MSFGSSVLQQAASLGVLLGFAKNLPNVAIVSGIFQSVLNLAFPPDDVQQASDTAAIVSAIQAEGDLILQQMREDENRLTMATLTDSQDYFFRAQTALGLLNTTDQSISGSADADNLRTELSRVKGYLLPGTPESIAVGDIEGAPATSNDSLSIYLFAATLYMNWCKLGMMDQLATELNAQASLLADYRKRNPNWATQPIPTSLQVPTSFADLVHAPHRDFLLMMARRAIAWARPIVDGWTSANAQLITDLANRKADFSVFQSGALWSYRDAKSGQVGKYFQSEMEAQMQMSIALGQAEALINSTFDQTGVPRDASVIDAATRSLNAIVSSKDFYVEPLVQTLTLTAGSASITIDKATGPSGNLLVPPGDTTIVARYQRAGGVNEPIATTGEFALQLVPGSPTNVSWSSLLSTSGLLSVSGLASGASTSVQLSLYHAPESHVDFGPVTVTLQVS